MPKSASDTFVGKAEGAMRTIGEISEELGVKPHILRYWEAQFDMLQPLKRAGGRRYYRPQDVALLHQIDRLLNHEGFTVRGARQYLATQKGALPVQQQARPAANDQALDKAKLRSIRDQLAAALQAA